MYHWLSFGLLLIGVLIMITHFADIKTPRKPNE
jgi:hypothetical protein